MLIFNNLILLRTMTKLYHPGTVFYFIK